MEIVPHSRAIEYTVKLSAEEAVALYWAVDDLVSRLDAGVSRRDEFPRLKPLFEIYDGLYRAGVSP